MVQRTRRPTSPPGAESPPPRPPRRRSRPPRNRAGELVVISVLVALFMLLGLGGMLWAIENRIALGPTPTPTPTDAPRPTATADFRATQIAQDFLTQVAYEIAQLRAGIPTPTPETPTPPPVAIEPEPTLAPPDEVEPEATPTLNNLLLPGIGASEPPPTAEPLPAEPTPDESSIIALPIVGDSPLPTPDEAPVVEPTPGDLPPPTPTEFPTEPPPLPTPEPTPTPLPYMVNSLRAVVIDRTVSVYVGPSSTYTSTGAFGANTAVTLLGRNPSGEWVVACCLDGQSVWIRQAYAPPRDNELGAGAPEDSNPNDVRWLPVQPIAPELTPLPVATRPPFGEFPMIGYERNAQGRLPELPRPPLPVVWSEVAQAAGALTSPAVVFRSSVLVASADGHLYSFDRTNGNQRWRYNIGTTMSIAPLIHGGEIFLVDDIGRLHALEDRGNEAIRIWGMETRMSNIAGLTAAGDSVFLTGVRDGSSMLVAFNRDNGVDRYVLSDAGSPPRYPAIGDQLGYLPYTHLRAFDLISSETVWERRDLNNFQTNAVYGAPGVRSLAELYVIDGNNRIWAFDANTGRELWNLDNGEPATSLGLSDAALLVAGNGYIKAISRQTVTQLWRTPIAGPVMGIPLNDGSIVLALTQPGNVYVLDVSTGNTIGSAITFQAGGAPAVSESYIYVPGANGRLYALRGN